MDKESKNTDYYTAQNKMELLPNYYQWVYKLIAEYLEKRIADLGCGKGFMLKTIHEQSNHDLLLGIDGSQESISNNVLHSLQSEKVILLHRNFDNYSFEDLIKFKIDTVMLLDVLEHIRYDETLLETIYQVLPERGKLIVKVPAIKRLYGSIDVASEHFRRYARKELKNKAESSGFKALKVDYMNLFGVLPYFVKNRVLKKNYNLFKYIYTSKAQKVKQVGPIFAESG